MLLLLMHVACKGYNSTGQYGLREAGAYYAEDIMQACFALRAVQHIPGRCLSDSRQVGATVCDSQQVCTTVCHSPEQVTACIHNLPLARLRQRLMQSLVGAQCTR